MLLLLVMLQLWSFVDCDFAAQPGVELELYDDGTKLAKKGSNSGQISWQIQSDNWKKLKTPTSDKEKR